jgi:hypothetical protein
MAIEHSARRKLDRGSASLIPVYGEHHADTLPMLLATPAVIATANTDYVWFRESRHLKPVSSIANMLYSPTKAVYLLRKGDAMLYVDDLAVTTPGTEKGSHCRQQLWRLSVQNYKINHLPGSGDSSVVRLSRPSFDTYHRNNLLNVSRPVW